MNEFVEECRREWRRLRVPDPVADEMAVELTADLAEAETEGASTEDVLGGAASDPRAFAAAWATERGVIGREAWTGHGLPRRSRTAAAVVAFALVALVGAVLLIVASPSAPRRLTFGSAVEAPSRDVMRVRVDGPMPSATRAIVRANMARAETARAEAAQATALAAGRLSRPAPSPARIVVVDINDSGVDTRTAGAVLLALGITGVVLMTIFLVRGGRQTPSVV